MNKEATKTRFKIIRQKNYIKNVEKQIESIQEVIVKHMIGKSFYIIDYFSSKRSKYEKY